MFSAGRAPAWLRTLHGGTLATNAGIDNALCRRRRRRDPRRRAVISSVLGIAGVTEVIIEYVLGFAFGWTIFQALFMRDMAGGVCSAH